MKTDKNYSGHKWWASYTGVGEFSLLSTKRHDHELNNIHPDSDSVSERNALEQMKGFYTLSAAKRYIKDCLREDRGALMLAYSRLEDIKCEGVES